MDHLRPFATPAPSDFARWQRLEGSTAPLPAHDRASSAPLSPFARWWARPDALARR